MKTEVTMHITKKVDLSEPDDKLAHLPCHLLSSFEPSLFCDYQFIGVIGSCGHVL